MATFKLLCTYDSSFISSSSSSSSVPPFTAFNSSSSSSSSSSSIRSTKLTTKTNKKKLQNGFSSTSSVSKFFFRTTDDDDTLHSDFSHLTPQLMSLEKCFLILKHLVEGHHDIKAMQFFDWMTIHGKLNHNVGAYCLALRVLARRGHWDQAEVMIRDMGHLNFQVFNTLIYASSKRGLVQMATKWFNAMLDTKVLPNVATFGMLMSLYQKGLHVDKAEFAFHQMRAFGIKCQSAYSSMITIYNRLALYEKAEQIIRLLHEDKVILNLENWLVLLNTYSQQGKLEHAERLLISMQQSGFPPNIIAYNTLITGYGKVSNMDAARRVFMNLKNVGLKPDESSYRSMIEGWGRADNYKEAKWCYEELKSSGFTPSSSNLYTLINSQAKHGDEEGAIVTFEDMVKMGCQFSSMLSTLLQAYEKAGKINKVPSILKGSFYQHILVNPASCSVLLMAYIKHYLVDDTIQILREKQWKDPTFQDNLYHLLICSLRDSGHLENAVKLYTFMPKSDFKPNMHISSTMIDIYSAMGQFTEADSLYLKLKSSHVPLDTIAFTIIIRMYVKSGLLAKACDVLETMENQKSLVVVPDVYLLRDMLRIYQKCDMRDKLANLYYKILKSGITWDQEMYNCVINCCARALPVDELSKLFEDMLLSGFTPNTITINVILDVYGKYKLFKKARKVLWIAKNQGLVDVISYNTLIAAYGHNKDITGMLSTVEKMQFNGFTVSLEAYNAMLNVYGKEGDLESFKSVLRKMKESRCGSDQYTYNIMINIYGEQGWIEEVGNVLRELKASGLGPDLCSYNTLIKAYGIAGMVEDAVDIVKEMRERGVEPDKRTYMNLIGALRRNDMFLEAVKWSLWMKQMGM